jgi:hypothetical protein
MAEGMVSYEPRMAFEFRIGSTCSAGGRRLWAGQPTPGRSTGYCVDGHGLAGACLAAWVPSQLGILCWRRTEDGKPHAVTGQVVRLPQDGTLHMQRLVVDQGGTVKDIGGYVEPDEAPGR